MAYRKRTLRRLPPTARRIAEAVAIAEGLTRRLKRLTEEVAELERETVARRVRESHYAGALEVAAGALAAADA